ncbi:zinc carboxypeptidase [Pseudomassariella vexata]|uniref:Carboxypeptidase M14A n=1 Tax=Pseudomassariella vexata TaxID=1141098 RepID=A0A1Y2EAE8_9PEZI|nr:zinc carboxypeptidase [Pseudomassariella vexata]ORY68560.1 zinc carboxypeptidase [Pseudomassariella vexata]
MKFFRLILSVVSVASATVITGRDGKVSYDGYKVFRIEAADGIKALEETVADASLLPLHGHGDHLDVAVSPDAADAFAALNLTSQLMVEDLGAAIATEGPIERYDSPAEVAAVPSLSWFNAYHSYADHVQWVKDLQAALPQNSEVINVGTSFEGRQIQGIHLWGTGGSGSKPAVYLHGTVHAREWVATMVVEYIAYQLVIGYENDTTVQSFLSKYDFYILPVVNPDGFVYTQSTDRLWRKNRMTRSSTSAVGTDINRNWPYKWEVAGGASTNPSAEDFKGLAAGDTPEVKVLKAFTDKLAAGKGIKLYIDYHSYGQYILLPYGYSCSAVSKNSAKQNSLAATVRSTIAKSYGKTFTYGPICSTLYEATGGSTDYMTDVSGAELAWAIELRGGGSGTSGFVLPVSEILPSGIEIWEGMKYLIGSM